MTAVILAAGRGSRLGHLTNDSPKCLVNVFGKPLIHWQNAALKKAGIPRVEAVGGYKADLLRPWASRIHINNRWSETNMVASLLCAEETMKNEGGIVSYSDIFYSASTVSMLLNCNEHIAITYDPNWRELWSARFEDPLADAETFKLSTDGFLLEIGRRAASYDEIQGQYMGLLKFSAVGWASVMRFTGSLDRAALDRLDMTSMLNALLQGGARIAALPAPDFWGEVDHESDIHLYEGIAEKRGRHIEDLLGV